jgi:hypothetical protein
MAAIIKLTHKIAIQLHLVAEISTIRSSRSRRPSGNFNALVDSTLYSLYRRNLEFSMYYFIQPPIYPNVCLSVHILHNFPPSRQQK